MKTFSTRQAAKKLGIHFTTLAQHIAAGKLPSPKVVEVSGVTIHAWTEEEIEKARKLLPKIANGRKTRYKKQSALSNQQSGKKHSAVSTQQSVKTKKPKTRKSKT